jgi:hypothetical protein
LDDGWFDLRYVHIEYLPILFGLIAGMAVLFFLIQKKMGRKPFWLRYFLVTAVFYAAIFYAYLFLVMRFGESGPLLSPTYAFTAIFTPSPRPIVTLTPTAGQ